jgi:hypothetical protein
VVATMDTAKPRGFPDNPMKLGCFGAFPKDAVEPSEAIVVVFLPVKGRIEKRKLAPKTEACQLLQR